MRTRIILPALVGMIFFMAGCGPADSLYALFTQDDKVFDEKLLGKWRWQESEEPQEEDGALIFRRGEDAKTYEVELISATAEKEANMIMSAHLVSLGDCLFIDFGTPDLAKVKFHKIPFPIIEGHIFGTIATEGKKIHIHLLDDDWVQKQAAQDKLTLGWTKTPQGVVLTAPTPELRKFALEHVHDRQAFSDREEFYRQK